MDIYDFDTYIFDFDGVIVDSEYYHYLSYKKAIEELQISFELSYEKYCKINHSLNELHFKQYFPEKYEILHARKRCFYNEFITTHIELKKGFEDFYKSLVIKGKKVFLVSDTSDEIFSKLAEKYPILKTINHRFTSNNVTSKKPNPAGYIEVLKTLTNIKTDLKKIICFEDSLRGYAAASKVIYNVVLVNDATYYYYHDIPAANIIVDFDAIKDFVFKFTHIESIPFYISSKTRHIQKWSELKKNKLINMTASWVDNEKPKNEMTISEKEDLCQSFLDDIKSSKFGIFYSEIDDTEQIGSFIEFGILVSLNKPIYIMGFNKFKGEVFSHISTSINYEYVDSYSILKNILNIYIDISSHYINFCEIVAQMIQNVPEKSIMLPVVDYVAIVASGEGTRLMPLTKDIPKLLVCVKNESILNNIVQYWKNYTKKFIIVIHSKYNRMIKFYMDLLKVEYTIINVNIRKGQENSYTIYCAFKSDEYVGKKILITWCDIYPCSSIPLSVLGDTNVIFTYKNFGRYDAYDNKIIKKPFGNVIGIYYFASFKHITQFEESMDICDCYSNHYAEFNTYEIEDLVDIGDMDKLDSLVKTQTNTYITRYFNKISEVNNTILLKESTCSYGDKIINDELLFYKFCFLRGYTNVPSIWKFSTNSFEMEKITGKTVYNTFLTKPYDTQCGIIKNIIMTLQKLHSQKIPVNRNNLNTDIYIEFFDKVRSRLNNIKPLLDEFSFIKTVNNVAIVESADKIIETLFKNIQEYFSLKESQYSVIHGDPHMSNMMIEDTTIKFIDPRGYFGKTKIFGLSEYDIGKILYSLSGFDIFNNDEKFCFYISSTNIDIPVNNVINNFIHLFEGYDKNLLLNMVILHWFGLTDYSKTNIHKCISAYYYALYLYHI
jgi:beta-phosphoglucomutase-like phosphatase (HAD superfamily)/thiamine kinase-like enzyme